MCQQNFGISNGSVLHRLPLVLSTISRMASTFDFAAWPPKLSKEQLEILTLLAKTYALSTGHLYLPLVGQQPTIPSTAIHAPFSLFPSPFPRRLFEKAQRIQKAYNILYARVTVDENFLDNVMGAELGLGKVDDFIGELWRGWKQLREVGLVQVRPNHRRIEYTSEMRGLANSSGLVPLRLSPSFMPRRRERL